MSAFKEKQKLWDEFLKFPEHYKWHNEGFMMENFTMLCIAIVMILVGTLGVVFVSMTFVLPLVASPVMIGMILLKVFSSDAALIVVSPDGYLVRRWEPKLRAMLIDALLTPDMYAIVLRVRDGSVIDHLHDQPWRLKADRPELFVSVRVRWVESGCLVVRDGSPKGNHDIIGLADVCKMMNLLLSSEMSELPADHQPSINRLFGVLCLGQDVWLSLQELQSFLRLFRFMRAEAQSDRERALGFAIGLARRQHVEHLYAIVAGVDAFDRLAHSVQGLAFKLSLLGKISAFYHNDMWMVDVPEGGKAAAIMRWNELCDAYPHGELADTIKQTQQEHEAAQQADAQSRSKPPKSKKKEADPVQPT